MLSNYFQTFVHNNAEIENTLVELTKEHRKFKWIGEKRGYLDR